MTPFDPTAGPQDESDWLAVRYLLDELPADVAAAFEVRLAEDQAAREAVARATVLVQALDEAARPAGVVAPKRERVLRRVAAVVAAVAAVVLVGVFASRNGNVEPSVSRPLIAKDVDPARLVVLWADADEAARDALPAETAESGAADADTLLPPDWLLAAVQQEAGTGGDEPSLDAATDEIEIN
jgi:anti-sigma-K factor RskA